GRIAPSAFFANPAVTGALLQGAAASLSGNRLLLSAPVAQAIAANLKTGHLETARDQSELTSWDVFGDVTFRATDKLTLGVGLRYTRDDKTTRFDSAVLNGRSILGSLLGAATVASAGDPVSVGTANALATALAAPGAANIPLSALYPVPMFGLTFQPTNGNGSVVSQDLDYDTLTWRLTALYEVTEELNLYANYARGQRPQVLAVRAPAAPYGAPNFQPLKAEKVDSLEGGFKLATADRKLRWDTAVFYYRYNNFETTEQIGTRFVSTNAGKATGYGLETQATWRVMPMTELFGTYAYNHSRFDSGAYKGNRFRLTPDHSLSLGASVRFAAMGGEVELMPTYTWQSKIYFDDNNDKPSLQSLASGKLVPDLIQDEFQKAYGLLGLRIAYAPEGRNWRFEAYGENLTDEDYIMDAGNTGDGIGLPTMVTGAPRTYGVKIRYSY
ncbi:MAG: TonB-dependent receptor, partial [Asticcacaulis sp.]